MYRELKDNSNRRPHTYTQRRTEDPDVLHIPAPLDHPIRREPTTKSDSIRPLNPVSSDHQIRCDATT